MLSTFNWHVPIEGSSFLVNWLSESLCNFIVRKSNTLVWLPSCSSSFSVTQGARSVFSYEHVLHPTLTFNESIAKLIYPEFPVSLTTSHLSDSIFQMGVGKCPLRWRRWRQRSTRTPLHLSAWVNSLACLNPTIIPSHCILKMKREMETQDQRSEIEVLLPHQEDQISTGTPNQQQQDLMEGVY